MILLTGAKGQLGQALSRLMTERGMTFIPTDADTLDITDEGAVTEYFTRTRPEAVIHCAAYTDVNKAESERELCRRVNTEGTKNIAKACESVSAKLICISTDYVFDGKKDGLYEPDDETNPLNFYGLTKRDGENAVKEACTRAFIVRITGLFGGEKGNFVRTMLRLSQEKEELRVVNDQFISPTYAHDLAPLLLDMAQSEKYGVYHATNEGFCSWYELAKYAVSLTDSRTRFVPVTTEEYPTPALRPKNSRLSKRCLTENGFSPLPEWKDAVERYVRSL